ncbi:uncharacterized protein LOC129773275 [Toxorhynchites rutilus septentrionalis]|uniref:uncharacterized protein LOC129773275 n=1 Tax=Toxorhynchites rutilus septentrionalis TaxID=329112 RepID=UPI00247A711B|nr:uncharacterized protein LOC129773275 [Toxorhynchites rutilus septentrionalis]
MEFDGITASSPGDVANLSASFFQTVYHSTSPPLHAASFDRIQEHNLNLPTLNFPPDEVLKALHGQDASKGPGVDGIPPSLLKHCAHSLAFPVSCIFNLPIHKAGNRNHVKNCCGISLPCCTSKVFEKLVHNALYNVVHPLISEFQHGFVQHRSTTTNLLCYTNTLFREVEARQQIDSIDRSPILRVDQLSTVSSLLSAAVLFVNDLCPRISSYKPMFAEDLKMYRVVRTTLDCLVLQKDFDEMLLWCNVNDMRANVEKCKAIQFTRRIAAAKHQYHIGSVPQELVLRFSPKHPGIRCTCVGNVPHHSSLIIRIERIQKCFIRFALRNLLRNDPSNLPDYSARCMLIGMETLRARRTLTLQLMIFDLLRNNIDCPQCDVLPLPAQFSNSILNSVPEITFVVL